MQEKAESARGRGDLEEGVCFDVLGASRSGAKPAVRILDQQLPQQVLGNGFDHGGVRRVAAQNASDGRQNLISDESVFPILHGLSVIHGRSNNAVYSSLS